MVNVFFAMSERPFRVLSLSEALSTLDSLWVEKSERGVERSHEKFRATGSEKSEEGSQATKAVSVKYGSLHEDALLTLTAKA